MRQDVLGCGLSLDGMSSYSVARELICDRTEKARIINFEYFVYELSC
jgi:hypothetical protein